MKRMTGRQVWRAADDDSLSADIACGVRACRLRYGLLSWDVFERFLSMLPGFFSAPMERRCAYLMVVNYI